VCERERETDRERQRESVCVREREREWIEGTFDRDVANGLDRVQVQGAAGRRGHAQHLPTQREFFIVRNHFIIVVIRWTGIAPWEFEFKSAALLVAVAMLSTCREIHQVYEP